MEIARHQFLSSLPAVQKAIDECEFMAIDTELSGTVDSTFWLEWNSLVLYPGLHRPAGSRRLDTLANRYAEYREATRRFIIIQFGLCTFKWDEPSGRYIAKAFNFYIFPTSMTGKIQPDRLFLTQAQAFDFLSKQGFDFNKVTSHDGLLMDSFDSYLVLVDLSRDSLFDCGRRRSLCTTSSTQNVWRHAWYPHWWQRKEFCRDCKVSSWLVAWMQCIHFLIGRELMLGFKIPARLMTRMVSILRLVMLINVDWSTKKSENSE